MTTQANIPPDMESELDETEEAQFIADVDDQTITATNRRLLIQEDIGVSAIDYEDIASVKPVTKSKKLKRFYIGIGLVLLTLPGLIQGSTGALVLFPIGAIVALWGYDRSKVVEITTRTHADPLQFNFSDPPQASSKINSLRTGTD